MGGKLRVWSRCGGALAVVLLGCSGQVRDATTPPGKAGDRNNVTANGQTTGGGIDGGGHGGIDGAAATNGSTGGPTSGGPSGTTGDPPPPTPKVADCEGLGAPGVFEEITPPGVMGVGQDGGGTFAMAVDPVNQGTLYVGTRSQKIWKSTDCGATWIDLTQGRNGPLVGSGMNWTLAVDPQEPEVVYTNSGYSSGIAGLFKSKNGGKDWDLIWPPPSQPELAKAFTYNFANVIALDPTNHRHVLLTFHESCLAPHPATCIAESMDAGQTWKLLDGRPEWNGNEGQVISFLQDSSHWLWGSQSNGFWVSGDSGSSWEAIPGMTTSHLQGSQLVQTQDGSFFQAGADGVWRSPDGTASTWKLIPDTGPIVGGLVTDGANLYASTCYFTNFCNPRYLVSPESDGNTWKAMTSPTLSQGGTMGYDAGHKLLYSSNLMAGLWRVVVP